MSLLTKLKISQSLTGKPLSEEHKVALSISQIGNTNGKGNRGKIVPQTVRDKISNSKKGKSVSEETKQKLRKPKSNTENMKGRRPQRTCPHCNKTGHAGPMIRFHFENCKLKSKTSLQ